MTGFKARRFRMALLFGSLLLTGAAMAGPGGKGGGKTPFTFDHYVHRGGTTYIQMEDGSLTPLMDLKYIKERPQLDEMAEARGEEIRYESLMPTATPASVDLSAYQTPIRNQQDRGTCWVFAIVAGVEARYRHDYNTSLDLSEQYFNHLAKSTGIDYPKYYKYENQSSYWGGGGSGCVVSAKDYSIPLETYAPYKSQSQMDSIRTSIPEAGNLAWNSDPKLNTVTQEQVDAFEYSPKYIPTSAALNAIYGVTGYALYDSTTARNTASLETILAGGKEVIIDVDLKWKYNSTTGVYDYDSTSGGGGHSFLLIGYDRAKQYFLVKNSWGGTSYYKVSYTFFQNCAWSAATVNAVKPTNSAADPKGRFIGFWASDHDGWKGKLVIRRTTGSSNSATRLGSYYDSSNVIHAINGYSTDSNHGVLYYMASVAENAPGTLTGQQFVVDQYSWDANYAAGVTYWNSIGYGVALSRTALNAPYSSSFAKSEWIGTWKMDHDGWIGTLKITAISSSNAITATYLGNDGITYSVTGTINSSYNHVLNFTINFSTPQKFTLYYHTWDDKLASGYTAWNSSYFGAHAVRQ